MLHILCVPVMNYIHVLVLEWQYGVLYWLDADIMCVICCFCDKKCAYDVLERAVGKIFCSYVYFCFESALCDLSAVVWRIAEGTSSTGHETSWSGCGKVPAEACKNTTDERNCESWLMLLLGWTWSCSIVTFLVAIMIILLQYSIF